MIKSRLRDFLRWHVTLPLRDETSEVLYQGLFPQQCANAGIRNDFYPVGGAANYSLMYVLCRILTERDVKSIVEVGSGQTTILIDRVRSPSARHVCYEHDPVWYADISRRLMRCDYRLRPLERRSSDAGHALDAYADIELLDFDLLLVDGPPGGDRYSRFACIDLIAASRLPDYAIVFDDAKRGGERETIEHAVSMLRGPGVDLAVSELHARKRHAILSAGRFRAVSHC